MEITKRKKYTIQNLVTDLKKIEPSPSTIYKVGAEIIYTEWDRCNYYLGADHLLTRHMQEFLNFLENDYEQMLLEAQFCKSTDTPKSALTAIMKDWPKEFTDYLIIRDADYVHKVLQSVAESRQKELEEYKNLESGIRKQLDETPDSAELWNQLRLVSWILGKYKDAADAYKKAKELGWESDKSKLVAVG